MLKFDSKQKQVIENNALALASVNVNGSPHVVAAAFVKVVAEDKILVTNNYMNTTIENIQKNKQVALAVWNKDWEENCCGFEFIGIAEYFTSGEWYDKVKQLPENIDEPCKGALLITIKKVKRLA
ncbi:pyridoxamine 5'-phosphate oxidase family protein [Candidatus Kuenenbacteria bacterium]|nr:pyridoxamine 5'-phosphate oxidase family protein [Candidatus Kuenenbacteria bacterium]